MSAGPSKSRFPNLWPLCRSVKLCPKPTVVLNQTSPGGSSGSFKVSFKTVEGKLWRVVVPCLLYTCSQVSTISEKFFKEYLAEKWEDIHPTFMWLKITAASGLELPYMGYVELVLQLAAKIQGGTRECGQVRQLTVSKRYYTIFTISCVQWQMV